MSLSSRFDEAMVFASRLHANQARKGSGVPYIAHLLVVTAMVLEQGGDEDEAIAALLHDAIEDQGGPPTREEIRRRFGDRVTAIVDGCTDGDTVPKAPWQSRKEDFIASIPAASPSVRLVVAADKLHNTRSLLRDYRLLGDALWDRFTGRRNGTLWYYRTLTNALLAASPSPLVLELARAVAELERLVAEPPEVDRRVAGG